MKRHILPALFSAAILAVGCFRGMSYDTDTLPGLQAGTITRTGP